MPTINTNGSNLHYIEQGKGNIPVVFVHGLLLSSNMWMNHYLPSLPSQYRAFALDMRGHGKSNTETGCTISIMAEDIYEFAQKLNLGKFVYVGVSMGGGIGIQLSLNHQEILSALILVSPLTGFGASGTFMFRLMGSFIAQKRWILRKMILGLCSKRPPEELLDKVLDDAMLVKGATLREFISEKRPIFGLEGLNKVSIPTLVIIGEKDKAIPVEQQILLADSIPKAKKIIYQEDGHMVAGEKQEVVLRDMVSFLDDAIK